MNFRSRRGQRDDPEMDLTPLIDIVFLLLIFFLVTATFSQRDRSLIPIDLPEGSSGTAAPAIERRTLLLQPDGTVHLQTGGETVEVIPQDRIAERLDELHGEDSETPLYLRGDQEVRYGEVMRLLDLVRETGFRRVYNVIYREQR